MIITSWRDAPSAARGATIALGNMDGVHLGHAAVLRAAHAAMRCGGYGCGGFFKTGRSPGGGGAVGVGAVVAGAAGALPGSA